jgi:hypothetical protein
MFNEEVLFRQYRGRGITQTCPDEGRDGELYLTLPTALDFVADCNRNQLAIIGIEGFTYQNGLLRARLDLIADLSAIETSNFREYKEACNRSAQDFIFPLYKNKGIVLSFVVLSENEWVDYFKPAHHLHLNGKEAMRVMV